MEINFEDAKWRFAERVKRLVDKGRTQQEAEETVKTVILTKEVVLNEEDRIIGEIKS